MTMTTGTQSNNFEAADSRFFNTIEISESTDELKRFGSHLIDASGLVTMQRELTELADILHKNAEHAVGLSLAPYYREAIHESRDALLGGLEIDEGFVVVKSMLPSNRMMTGYTALNNDYGISDEPITLVVPANKITARQVNLRESKDENLFNPVIDMRVQTNSDSTISKFVAPGEIAEEMSPGQWYRFPLATTIVTVYS